MTSPVISGIISNILQDLDDESTLIYPSGKIQQKIFSCLPGLNGYLGTYYSGDNTIGIISPEISGLSDQRILEVYVEQELLRKEMLKGTRVNFLTAITEGDSRITIADSASALSELYKQTTLELKNLIKQSKYTSISNAPTAIRGSDASIPDYSPQQVYP